MLCHRNFGLDRMHIRIDFQEIGRDLGNVCGSIWMAQCILDKFILVLNIRSDQTIEVYELVSLSDI